MAKYRRLSRTMALQTITALFLRSGESSEKTEECFRFVKKEFAPELGNQDEFARELVNGVLEHRAVLDQKIGTFAPEWPVEKLSPIERGILELGAFELMFQPDTPLAVVINEWVDVAKEFGDETAGKFVNGVLSSLAHAVRSVEPSRPKTSSERVSS